MDFSHSSRYILKEARTADRDTLVRLDRDKSSWKSDIGVPLSNPMPVAMVALLTVITFHVVIEGKQGLMSTIRHSPLADKTTLSRMILYEAIPVIGSATNDEAAVYNS